MPNTWSVELRSEERVASNDRAVKRARLPCHSTELASLVTVVWEPLLLLSRRAPSVLWAIDEMVLLVPFAPFCYNPTVISFDRMYLCVSPGEARRRVHIKEFG